MFSKSVLDQFNYFEKLSIRYAIFAGAEVSLLTKNRKPTDIDIIIHNDDFEKLLKNLPQAKHIFNGVYHIMSSDGQKITCTADTIEYSIEKSQFDIMSNCIFKSKNNICQTFLTDLAVKNRINISIEDTSIWLANPVDTILIKSLMRRGQEQNKFDVEDCEALIKSCQIDKTYLSKRLKEVNINKAAKEFIKKIKLIE